MTAPGTGATGKTRTADDLVEALVDKDEYRAVLQYARLHNLERDNAVLFMVAMLKVFAYVYDRLVAQADLMQLRISALMEESHSAEQRFATKVGEHVALLQRLMRDHVGTLGSQTAQMTIAVGEMKVLREQLEKVTQDAERTLAALEGLKDSSDVASLTKLIDQRLTAALSRRVAATDEVFRERMLDIIHQGMTYYIRRLRIQTFVIVAVATFVVFLARR